MTKTTTKPQKRSDILMALIVAYDGELPNNEVQAGNEEFFDYLNSKGFFQEGSERSAWRKSVSASIRSMGGNYTYVPAEKLDKQGELASSRKSDKAASIISILAEISDKEITDSEVVALAKSLSQAGDAVLNVVLDMVRGLQEAQ